ncbi:MAG: GDP-mannose 4,6-dehydratase [Candidatus Methanoperedens sp.]|nr:GDP-mannose 4,6-dehydratase [Candidatus Methanoperedens sp.]
MIIRSLRKNSSTTKGNSYQMNNKKIIITGINGFIGRNFLHVILEKSPDAQIYGIYRALRTVEHFIPVECDLSDREKVKCVLSEIRPDYIFHFAGTAYTNDWDILFSSNVRTTLNLLESVKELEFNPRIVIIGSAAEYGIAQKMPVNEMTIPNPASPYGASMCCRTNVALVFRNMGFDIIIGRVFNTTGADVTERTPVGSFARQIAQIEKGINEPVIYAGNLEPVRDFIDISDVAEAFYALAMKSEKGGIYNICSGAGHSIADILDIYVKLIPHHKITILKDKSLLRKNDIPSMYGDYTKIKEETGWEPSVPLNESLKSTLNFFRNRK